MKSIPLDATLISARLELFLEYTTGDATSNVGVHYCSDNAWTELGITWYNAPSFKSTPTHITAAAFDETWYSWAITEDVNRARCNQQLSLVLFSESETIVNFIAKEPTWASMYKPKLVIVYTVPDTTPPTIDNVNVFPNFGKSGTVFTISAEVDDPSSIGSVVARIQKTDESNIYTVALTDTDSDGIYIGEWNSTGAGGGVYHVDIIATDTLGNEDEKENDISFRVDNVSPSISNVEHQPVNPMPNDEVVITCVVIDESGVEEIYLYYSTDNGTSWIKASTIFSKGSYKATIPKQAEGATIQYYFEAFDNAKNTVQSDICSYIVKNTVPPDIYLLITLSAIAIIGISLSYYVKRKLTSSRKTKSV